MDLCHGEGNKDSSIFHGIVCLFLAYSVSRKRTWYQEWDQHNPERSEETRRTKFKTKLNAIKANQTRLSRSTHSHPSSTWLTANRENLPSVMTRLPACGSGVGNSTPGACSNGPEGHKQESDFPRTLGQGQSSV